MQQPPPQPAAIKAYLLTIENSQLEYKAFAARLQQLLSYLKPKLIKIAVIVEEPLHAHIVCFFSTLPMAKIRQLQAKGWYIHAKPLPNSYAVNNAVNYCLRQDEKHSSSFIVMQNGGENMAEGKKKKVKISEVLERILDKLEELDERISELENSKTSGSTSSKSNSNSNSSVKLPLTLKQGDKGYMLFLNSYKIVRNSPMVILSGKQLAQLKAQIDMLLNTSKSGKKLKRVEGFENALEEL